MPPHNRSVVRAYATVHACRARYRARLLLGTCLCHGDRDVALSFILKCLENPKRGCTYTASGVNSL